MALDPGFASPFSKSQKASLEIFLLTEKLIAKTRLWN